jgi:hypothetical protein
MTREGLDKGGGRYVCVLQERNERNKQRQLTKEGIETFVLCL